MVILRFVVSQCWFVLLRDDARWFVVKGLLPNSWMVQDATWYTAECLGPGRIMLDGDPAPPPRKGTQQSPVFGSCLWWPNGRPSQQLLPKTQSIGYCTSKKCGNILLPLTSPNAWRYLKCFHAFTTKSSLKFRLQLVPVATLPCEIFGAFTTQRPTARLLAPLCNCCIELLSSVTITLNLIMWPVGVAKNGYPRVTLLGSA